MIPPLTLLVVGHPGIEHVGAHLFNAARSLGVSTRLCNVQQAWAASWLSRKVHWWLCDRRPPRLRPFADEIVRICRELRPECLLATGVAPLSETALEEVGSIGVRRINFLTDDPFNPAHRAGWFVRALTGYDQMFSPRRDNMDDLRAAGCRAVTYLPFAYAPEIHFPEPPEPHYAAEFDSDIVFIGGADSDRVAPVSRLIESGFKVALYGGYWDRWAATRPHSRGMADPATMRRAIAGARVVLCLVRRANRDGHAMRSFEAPACGACCLMEYTAEHEDIFGSDGEAVAYFRSQEEMVTRLRLLLNDAPARRRMAEAASQLIRGGPNTYADRLRTMLEPRSSDRAEPPDVATGRPA